MSLKWVKIYKKKLSLYLTIFIILLAPGITKTKISAQTLDYAKKATPPDWSEFKFYRYPRALSYLCIEILSCNSCKPGWQGINFFKLNLTYMHMRKILESKFIMVSLFEKWEGVLNFFYIEIWDIKITFYLSLKKTWLETV